MRLFIEKRPWTDNNAMYLMDKTNNNLRAYVSKIEMTTLEPSETPIIEPSFYMSNTDCQELIDELWRSGFRPSEGTGSAGALSATQKHLEDMRRLVFDK